MEKLKFDYNKEKLCRATVMVGSAYDFANGWKNDKDERAYKADVYEKLPFGDFKQFEFSTDLTRGLYPFNVLKNVNDDKQRIQCCPDSFRYVGSRDGLALLEDKIINGNFVCLNYLKTDNIADVFNLSREEVDKILVDNKDVIRNNIKEFIQTNSNVDKDDVTYDVFEYIRFSNTADKNYTKYGFTNESMFKKTVEIFDEMVKNKELSVDRNGFVHLVARTNEKGRRASLKPRSSVKENVITYDISQNK